MPKQVGPRGRMTESVLVKLTAEQREALDAAALVYRVSSPELLRKALDELLVKAGPQVQAVLKSVYKARAGLSG